MNGKPLGYLRPQYHNATTDLVYRCFIFPIANVYKGLTGIAHARLRRAAMQHWIPDPRSREGAPLKTLRCRTIF